MTIRIEKRHDLVSLVHDHREPRRWLAVNVRVFGPPPICAGNHIRRSTPGRHVLVHPTIALCTPVIKRVTISVIPD